ncbi:MAG: amidohydrolase [Saprospiraceae bacterium]|nr:amidohydrolase [Saprospiraceae bacterium]
MKKAEIKIAWLIGASALMASCKVSQKADVLLFNGEIYTADSSDAVVEAIAISGDAILATGTAETLRDHVGDDTELVDLNGAFAMPGLIEGHGHFLGLGNSLLTLNLADAQSWSEIVAKTADAVKTAKPGQWIEGRGWHQEKWLAEADLRYNGYPYHDALSAVSPENPVLLVHASGHALLANAQAMELARVGPESASPTGGRIVRDDAGKLTGVFEENAMEVIYRSREAERSRLPETERMAALKRMALAASGHCLSYGICSFQDAGSNLEEIRLLKNLCDSGTISTRLWVMLHDQAQQLLTAIDQLPVELNPQSNFCCHAVKAYADGALGSYGAWLLESYSDKPGFRGQNTTPVDQLQKLAQACAKRGLQFCVHGIGDRANREILDLFESELAGKRDEDLRWRIEHAQHLHPDDIARFGPLGVIASMQAIHCTSDAPFVVKRLGEQRAREGAYPWRSLLDSGARLANGTDCPVEPINPFACMYAAITRKRAPGGEAFFPEQRMRRLEALRSYTIWNAYAAREEAIKGSLEPGKLADIAILDRNLLSCSDEELAQTRVLGVYLGGKPVLPKEEQSE